MASRLTRGAARWAPGSSPPCPLRCDAHHTVPAEAPIRGGVGRTNKAPRSNRAREHPQRARVSSCSTTPPPRQRPREREHLRRPRSQLPGNARRRLRCSCSLLLLVVGTRRCWLRHREKTPAPPPYHQTTKEERGGSRFEGLPFQHQQRCAAAYSDIRELVDDIRRGVCLLCMTPDAGDEGEMNDNWRAEDRDDDAPSRTYVRADTFLIGDRRIYDNPSMCKTQ